MTTVLASGRLQLSPEEIEMYQIAATLIVKTLRERIDLHQPMTWAKFSRLYLAHLVVIEDPILIRDVRDFIAREKAKRPGSDDPQT